MQSTHPVSFWRKLLGLLGWGGLFLLLVIAIFSFPLMPARTLDPSWRMALGYFYEHGLQFGPEVVFNYGPLGFIMVKTYSGLQFWTLIAGQLGLAVIAAAVLVLQARRLQGWGRWIFLLFVLLFGITYDDALHMEIIALLGFFLLRRGDEPAGARTGLIAILLSIYGLIKFTNLLLAVFVVLVACGHSCWRKRWREAGWLGLAFMSAYLVGWLMLGQHLPNLPAYLSGSWQISEGWLWSMGLPAPLAPLWKGVLILLLLIAYAFTHLHLSPDKPRAAANVLVLGAFIYLNWKHGFVRADGHMVGFFLCALLPLTAYPMLLDDPDRLRRAHRWLFAGAIVLGLIALENSQLWTTLHSVSNFQKKIHDNLDFVQHWKENRQLYRNRLGFLRNATDMPNIRTIVGQSTVDVLGYEQSVALFNRFNYQPRPVMQGYSTFNLPLARLNAECYASARAPEFVLMKIQPIDDRLPTIDDPFVLLIIAHRYEYVRQEKGFLLWKLKPGPFDPASVAPRLLQTKSVSVNQPLKLKELAHQPLWLKVDLQPSLLGHLRSFFYKPPQVKINVLNSAGDRFDYLLPLPQGRTGFIINPIIDDEVDYVRFASNAPEKRVDTVALVIAPEDEKYFSDSASVEISALPPSAAARDFFPANPAAIFPTFKNAPLTYDSPAPTYTAKIDDQAVAFMHAPSRMIFEIPPGAKTIRGQFGFLRTAYTDGGWTNGARFVISWSNGTKQKDLFAHYLNPVNIPADRGLQEFAVDLTGLTGGRLSFETRAGPDEDAAWDWTCWTKIEFTQ